LIYGAVAGFIKEPEPFLTFLDLLSFETFICGRLGSAWTQLQLVQCSRDQHKSLMYLSIFHLRVMNCVAHASAPCPVRTNPIQPTTALHLTSCRADCSSRLATTTTAISPHRNLSLMFSANFLLSKQLINYDDNKTHVTKDSISN